MSPTERFHDQTHCSMHGKQYLPREMQSRHILDNHKD